jgi:hypothetical protein
MLRALYVEAHGKVLHRCASNGYTRYCLMATHTTPYEFLLLCCTIFIASQNKPYIRPEARNIYLPTFSCFLPAERKVKVAPVQAIKLHAWEGGGGRKYHPILKPGIKCWLVFFSPYFVRVVYFVSLELFWH